MRFLSELVAKLQERKLLVAVVLMFACTQLVALLSGAWSGPPEW
jgi:hypothetical protein